MVLSDMTKEAHSQSSLVFRIPKLPNRGNHELGGVGLMDTAFNDPCVWISTSTASRCFHDGDSIKASKLSSIWIVSITSGFGICSRHRVTYDNAVSRGLSLSNVGYRIMMVRVRTSGKHHASEKNPGGTGGTA